MGLCALNSLGVDGRGSVLSLASIGISRSTTICSTPSVPAQQPLDSSNEEEDEEKTKANPAECFDSLKNAADFVMTPAPFEIRELFL